MSTRDELIRFTVAQVTKALVDKGKLIEAGFAAYRILAMHPAATPNQINECRMAYFAGAQHLHASMMSFLEPGKEPTEKDLNRLTLIDDELQAFAEELKLRFSKPQGFA